jgi:hypothetical protein
MAAQTEAPKTCSICGKDCSNTQRTKDAKGNYICAACVEQAKKTKQVQQNPPKPPAPAKKPQAAPADDDGDNSFLLELGTKAQALSGGKPCPQCEQVANQNDRLCLACGYDFESGKKLRTKIEKAKAPQGVPAAKSSGVEFTGVDWVLAVPLAGLGFWVGLVWLFTGNPKGKKMLIVSVLSNVIASVIAAAIQSQTGQ